MVLLSAFVTMGLTILHTLAPKPDGKGELPSMRFFIGSGMAFFGLAVGAQLRPRETYPFALLVMVTSMTMNGPGVIKFLRKFDQASIVRKVA